MEAGVFCCFNKLSKRKMYTCAWIVHEKEIFQKLSRLNIGK